MRFKRLFVRINRLTVRFFKKILRYILQKRANCVIMNVVVFGRIFANEKYVICVPKTVHCLRYNIFVKRKSRRPKSEDLGLARKSHK